MMKNPGKMIRFAFFGTSAKYIDAVRKGGFTPKTTHDLSSLRMMTSTGSPLSPEGFSFVYEGKRATSTSPRSRAGPTS